MWSVSDEVSVWLAWQWWLLSGLVVTHLCYQALLVVLGNTIHAQVYQNNVLRCTSFKYRKSVQKFCIVLEDKIT